MIERHILLPTRGVHPVLGEAALLSEVMSQSARGEPLRLPGISPTPFTVVDSISENGAKLIEIDTEAAAAIDSSPLPLKVVPEVRYELPTPNPLPSIKPRLGTQPALVTVVITCMDARTGAPLSGKRVIAFDDYAFGSGDEGVSDASGSVQLQLQPGTHVDKLFVLADGEHWGAYRRFTLIQPVISLQLEPVSASHQDAIRQLYTVRRYNPARGVMVGVLDTGIDRHRDINLTGGACTVTGEDRNAYGDIDRHGTHVAGLIGGTGGMGAATLGMAPGVPIRSYRVFDVQKGELGASNYAIMKAMIRAADEECDIINLSLGGGPFDPIVEEAIADARHHGMLVVIAAGNDTRQNVSYPAAYAGATAVSAMGIESGFPAGCYFAGEVRRPPYAQAALEYLAEFSNVGQEVACTGLGSGVLSTIPGNRIAPMSGTSMAAPMVAGCAASLLSRDPASFHMSRDRSRSNAIERLLQSNCVQRFGGGKWEGYGLPDPSSV